MARSGINRGFAWLRKVLQITEETESPARLSEVVGPTMDVFGWERLAQTGPESIEAVTGTLATDIAVLTPVPAGIARFVVFASCSHNDPLGLIIDLQVRTSGGDIGLSNTFDAVNAHTAQPTQHGLNRTILLQPGEQLICRSRSAPAAGTSLFIIYKFVDLDLGEYLPPI